MNLARVSGKLKEQIHVCSGKLSSGLPKVSRRFVEESICGIQTKQSVRLSEIARATIVSKIRPATRMLTS